MLYKRLCIIMICVVVSTLLAFGFILQYVENNDVVSTKEQDIDLYNQVQYTIFLQDILDNNKIPYDYYYDFLVNYLYPNGELSQQLHIDYIDMGY